MAVAPIPFRRTRPVRVEVHPIPPVLDRATTTTPSGSAHGGHQEGDAAYASVALWERLSLEDGEPGGAIGGQGICVVVEWSKTAGLGKRKDHNVVVRVEPLPGTSLHPPPDARVLYMPTRLLPPHATANLSAFVVPHEPIALTLAILQPVAEAESRDIDSELADLADLDLEFLLDRPQPNGGVPPGHHPFSSDRILREGDLIKLPPSSMSRTRSVRVLLTEPVRQGVLTPSTRLIVSTTPYRPKPVAGLNGDTASEGSIPRTHLSAALEEFDPDAFLSGSLSMQLGVTQPGDLPDGGALGEELVGSWSSSSGSLTPRPRGDRPESPAARVRDLDENEDEVGMGGTRFNAVRFGAGLGRGRAGDEVCWVGVGGLGRAGIFEGDWVTLRPAGDSSGAGARLAKVLAWEALDDSHSDFHTHYNSPANPILLPSSLHRALFPQPTSSTEIILSPTPFGARIPNLPVAKTMTLARVATTEGVDKRYERSWIRGLRSYFTAPDRKGMGKTASEDEDGGRLIRRGDVIAVPVYPDRPLSSEQEESPSTSDADSSDSEGDAPGAPSRFGWKSSGGKGKAQVSMGVAYFVVSSLSFDPLVPIEDDFRSSTSSKARAGEMGCWVDVAGSGGGKGATRTVLTGLERLRVSGREGDRASLSLPRIPIPWSGLASGRLRDLLGSSLASASFAYAMQLSILLTGARGSGKMLLVRHVADELGFNVVLIECYNLTGESSQSLEGTLRAALDKAKSAAPSILLLRNVEALAKKSDAPNARPAPIIKVLGDILEGLKQATGESGFPCVLLGITAEADGVDTGVAGCFKQNIELSAPKEPERLHIAKEALHAVALPIAPDVDLPHLAAQTAALQAADISSLLLRASDLALRRACMVSGRDLHSVQAAGVSMTAKDIESALNEARTAYSDSIGAPKIPDVKWEDVGGLAEVRKEILETVQLPLERPELFADGLKKRSGILLYGPPGTGKTLLAKTVATTCALNFFSVKGPELLNMYIGESEANVRRVFQRARDAAPCVIFMDELDSVAPKRGNQGDSGGVMDRIVSQLLAELDGMSSAGGSSAEVFVMGATNRPDLLDPALLRPGRFDRLIYLSTPQTHEAQADILKALTRKFHLDPALDLEDVAQRCPFNYTGADLYALASDAMLRAMSRTAGSVDARIRQLEQEAEKHGGEAGIDVAWPKPLTPQYYLGRMASKEEMEVMVRWEDFEEALQGLTPSVSEGEMEHYRRVQSEFTRG